MVGAALADARAVAWCDEMRVMVVVWQVFLCGGAALTLHDVLARTAWRGKLALPRRQLRGHEPFLDAAALRGGRVINAWSQLLRLPSCRASLATMPR
jgi:hypothetical protein